MMMKKKKKKKKNDAEMNDLVDDVWHHEPCELACWNR